ncbi:MAG: IS630 family transposase [Microcoleus sp. SU_5_3]|nr:IS630 family transposase [Microcoleus sp. SU_5_3]
MLKIICWLESSTPKPAKKGRKYWCQDETRIGLKTIERKKITACGVKPIGKVQWNFKAYYLYGAIAPETGESFWLEFSHLDSQCFQIFLDKLSQEYPDNLNVIQLDNGKFHHSYQLKIPDNIILIFQPPYSPELNPIERVWQHIKQELSWGIYENLDEIKEKVRVFLENFSHHTIASLTGWDYIRSALATLCMILEKWYSISQVDEVQ